MFFTSPSGLRPLIRTVQCEVKNWLFAQSMATLLLSIFQSIAYTCFNLATACIPASIYPQCGPASSPAAAQTHNREAPEEAIQNQYFKRERERGAGIDAGDGDCYDAIPVRSP